jgi:hypothetical protein
MTNEMLTKAERTPDILEFVGIGPPRTGTTWLHEILTKRARLPKHTKETRFFDIHFSKGTKWYTAHFDARGTLPRGELCPTYFSSELARQRIAALVPKVKIICTFRDPVDRIFSLYKIKRVFAAAPPTFKEALSIDRELLESSRYAFYLKKWQRCFGEENVLPTFYEDLLSNPQEYINRIADFVDISRFPLEPSAAVRVNSAEGRGHPRNALAIRAATVFADWLKAHRGGSMVSYVKRSSLFERLVRSGCTIEPVDPCTALRMREMLRPEIEALEIMLGKDLSAWKP